MRRLSFAVLLLLSLLVRAGQAAADDIVVMTSGAFTEAYLSLSKSFTNSSGNTFTTAATSIGTGAESIPSRLAAGESVDLVMVAAEALDQLIADGRVVRGSRRDLARSSIAVAVRRGATKPDVSSVDALKRAFLAAKSVAISGSVSGDYLVKELFPRLGIADQMRDKTQRILRERVGAVVARGEAELGVQQVSELKPIAGVEIVGLLPGDTQRATIFSAGIAASSKHPAAARAFLAYVTSPAAQKVIEETGLEPLASLPAQSPAPGSITRDPRYPAHWWSAVSKEGAPSWEILPQEAGPGEVILSKRHELGLLSNFAPTPFTFRGKRYASLEGFWQMMLYPEGPDDPRAKFPGIVWKHTRDEVAQMTAFVAKDAGTLAEENMAKMGIGWVTFEGKRIDYRPATPGAHYDLILAATEEKVRQNPEVKKVLLSTGDLVLKPDHYQGPNDPAAWRYFEILTKIRAEAR